ncbi:hypothetical protein E2562_033488 [Oryza meyeriana var. granulata]|uniref:Uncharacterized protein n=1 Tax=Oryza meyeriana var. granulata TaxID=110450 RepID=A0A6G1F0Z3_9ORYZ|nr:hypothetical protein E2562_033488 [Oryza meyeriana var. granulata]
MFGEATGKAAPHKTRVPRGIKLRQTLQSSCPSAPRAGMLGIEGPMVDLHEVIVLDMRFCCFISTDLDHGFADNGIVQS